MRDNSKRPEARASAGNMPEKKPRTRAAVILAITFLCFALSFSKETIRRYEEAAGKDQAWIRREEKDTCSGEWTLYRYEAIGLGFCYPRKWGTVTRSPDLPEDHAEEESGYGDSFSLLFSSNEDIALRVFNDAYGGERYPGYPAAGFVDNIGALKESGTACNYEKNFGYKGGYDVRIKETYAQCYEGIKTAIFDTQETSQERKDLSVLGSFAYKKLQNGYFDHLLVSYVYGDTSAPGKEYGSVEAILPEIGISGEEFGKEKEDFRRFVSSIEIFVPPAGQLPEIGQGAADIRAAFED